MKIKVLGPGCMKCKNLYIETEKALANSGIPAELEKVEKIEEIMKYGVLITPALIINDKVKSSGKVIKADEIASWIIEESTSK